MNPQAKCSTEPASDDRHFHIHHCHLFYTSLEHECYPSTRTAVEADQEFDANELGYDGRGQLLILQRGSCLLVARVAAEEVGGLGLLLPMAGRTPRWWRTLPGAVIFAVHCEVVDAESPESGHLQCVVQDLGGMRLPKNWRVKECADCWTVA
jgi:hypothetical protein